MIIAWTWMTSFLRSLSCFRINDQGICEPSKLLRKAKEGKRTWNSSACQGPPSRCSSVSIHREIIILWSWHECQSWIQIRKPILSFCWILNLAQPKLNLFSAVMESCKILFAEIITLHPFLMKAMNVITVLSILPRVWELDGFVRIKTAPEFSVDEPCSIPCVVFSLVLSILFSLENGFLARSLVGSFGGLVHCCLVSRVVTIVLICSSTDRACQSHWHPKCADWIGPWEPEGWLSFWLCNKTPFVKKSDDWNFAEEESG